LTSVDPGRAGRRTYFERFDWGYRADSGALTGERDIETARWRRRVQLGRLCTHGVLTFREASPSGEPAMALAAFDQSIELKGAKNLRPENPSI